MKGHLRCLVFVLVLLTALIQVGYGGKAAPASAQQLHGDEAYAFLEQADVLDQIAGDLDSTPPQGRPFLNPSPLTVSDGAEENFTGFSVALDGDTFVAGAFGATISGRKNQGAAYIFTRSDGAWTESQKLVAADGDAEHFFGYAVALEGDRLLIGSYGVPFGSSFYQGAAYVFTRSGNTWSQQQKLFAADGAKLDSFGVAVDLDGDTAVIGAPGAMSGQGAAYVFTWDGAIWSQQQKLFAAGGQQGDFFGDSVAVQEDTIAAGASLADVSGSQDQGAAYIFLRSGANWTEQQKLVASDGAALDFFGDSMSLSGDTLVVGANGADVGENKNQGAAYLFVRSGGIWGEQQILFSAHGTAAEWFGSSVVVQGDTVLVGAAQTQIDDNAGQGAVHVFTRHNATWIESQRLVAADGQANDYFGRSVALDGDTAIIGASSADVGSLSAVGKLYALHRQQVPWPSTASIVANDGASSDSFGIAVALDGDTALVGASNAVVGGRIFQGAAYIYVRSGPLWIQQQKLVGAGARWEFFGSAVELAGDTAVVGSPGADIKGSENRGAAYIFTRSGTIWSEQQKLVADTGDPFDLFGSAIALQGNTLILGAPGVDMEGHEDRGAAYLFTYDGSQWVQSQKLAAADGQAGDSFGAAVTLDGEMAVVSASGAAVNGQGHQGAAYVFQHDGAQWVQDQKLVAADGQEDDYFGDSVVLQGQTIAAGASWADDRQGAAYLFVHDGSQWVEKQKLAAPDGTANDRFGEALALDGDTLVAGAWLDHVGGSNGQGSAYVFTRAGDVWSLQQKLIAPFPDTNTQFSDFFGRAVALHGDRALVGADFATVDGRVAQGRAYFFERQKLAQTIDFPVPSTGRAGTQITLRATASSGLPLVYAANTAAVCTVSGSTASLLAQGTCTITAAQSGSADYAPAEKIVSFVVQPGGVHLPVIMRAS